MARTKHPGIYSRETADGTTVYDLRFRNAEGKQTTDRGYRTITLAKKALDQHKADVSTGKYIAPAAGRTKVRDVWEEVLTLDWSQNAARGVAARKSAWKTWVEPRWADVPVKKVTAKALTTWFVELGEEHGAKPATLTNIRVVLMAIFKRAAADGRIGANPAERLPIPKQARSSKTYLSHAQVKALLEAAGDDDAWRLQLELLTFNGLRVSEMAGLKVEDIDLSRKRISVVRSVDVLGGKFLVNPPKSGKPRQVPIFPMTIDLLKAQVKGKSGDDWLFPGEVEERPLNTDALAKRLGRLTARIRREQEQAKADAADLFPTVTPHELRHTAASLAIASGATVLAVQRMLGHSTPTMTLNTYSDLFEDDLDTLTEAVSKAHAAASVTTK
ncbi:tyrosine-type recombinase/integrase [Gordonia sp. (in: high G+C Gram-positive bacteria)]|uniref:tyrosine-type recombinase/integrase n=1 Tax=Gordonia sp. (in: high G+C Gram-positive bacteria) TaxID=84139 RepID=UPI003F9D4472